MAEAARNIYPAQFDASAANDPNAPNNGEVVKRRVSQKNQSPFREKKTSPYAASEQAKTVPIDDVEYLLRRYGIDYQPGYKRDFAEKDQTLTETSQTSYVNKTNQPTAANLQPTTTSQIPTSVRQQENMPPRQVATKPVKNRSSITRRVRQISGLVASLSFIATLGLLQLQTSVFGIVAFGIAGAIESVDALSSVVSWIADFTGFDAMSLFFIFWILSFAVGMIMVIGLLAIMTLKGLQPVSGEGVGVKIALAIGVFITASLPFFSLFTIPIAISWVVVVLAYA